MSKSNKSRKKKNRSLKSTGNNNVTSANDANLLKEYGLECEIVNIDPSTLAKNGYIRLSKDAFSRISAIFQFVPGMATNQVIMSAANEGTKKMLESAYKVMIKDGMHLANSKATEGAFRGTLLSNINNQVSGQAELLKIDPIAVSRAPQYALGVFNALSMVTGQYYLSEINTRLKGLETHVEDVHSFLADDKRSQLFASEQVLNEMFESLQFLKNNESEKQASLVDVKTIKREAIANMQFFNSQLTKEQNGLSPKNKKEEIEAAVKHIGELLPQYWCSLSIYSKALLLEVLLADIDDPDYLSIIQDSLLNYRSQYRNEYKSCQTLLTNLLAEAKSLNWNGNIPLALTAALAIVIPNKKAKVLVSATGAIATEKNEKNKAKAKKSIENDLNSFIDVCGDLEPIDTIYSAISKYKKIRNNPVELIQTSDETYIKYLEPNSDD